MEKSDLILLIFLVWSLFSAILLIGQTVFFKRLLKKIESALGPDVEWNRIWNVEKKNEFSRVSFDKQKKVFHWQGIFEERKTSYTLNVETGYAALFLTNGSDTLNIYQQTREVSESRITSLIPHKMEISGRTIYNTSLLKESGERKAIYEVLKDYFKNGVKRDAEFLSAESQETIDALIFGYHTSKRFTTFLKKTYPEFFKWVENYERKPLRETLSAFQPSEKTADELEIEIKKAIFEEDYQKAAIIRDRINKLNQP